MKTKINICLRLSLLLLATACTKDLDLEKLRPETRLVLNSIVVTGDPVTASISHTWFYTDNYPNVTLTDAQVQLYVNDRLEEKMFWVMGDSAYNSIGQYTSGYIPRTGDEIKIIASHDGKEASATTFLPDVCPIKKITTDSIFISKPEPGSSNKKLQFSITFQDNPGKYNYYLIRFEFYSPKWISETEKKYYWEPVIMGYENDPLFVNENDAMENILGDNWFNGNRGRVFSNDLFRGEEYTLKVYEIKNRNLIMPLSSEGNPEKSSNLYKVYLYTITESYYKYMKTFIDINSGDFLNDLANYGLAEPIYIHSNVKGGTGIVGGAALDTALVNIY